jgi:hypothetical protein
LLCCHAATATLLPPREEQLQRNGRLLFFNFQHRRPVYIQYRLCSLSAAHSSIASSWLITLPHHVFLAYSLTHSPTPSLTLLSLKLHLQTRPRSSMAARPKKLSKFKSDRTATSSLLPPDSRSSGGGGGGVVLGGIVEARDTSAAPLAALSCSAAASTGFPPYARAGKTLSLGASVSRSGSRRKPCPVTSSTLQHRDESFDCNDSDVSSEDFSSLNMKRVANMSEEDVQRYVDDLQGIVLHSSCTCYCVHHVVQYLFWV